MRSKTKAARHKSIIHLSEKDARKVLSLLDNPPKPNKRLKNAVKEALKLKR